MIMWFHRLRRLFTYNNEHQQKESTADPVQMVDELLRDMDSELTDLHASLNKQIASEKRLQRRLELAEADSRQREDDAIRFIEHQDDPSAKQALLKKDEKDREIQEIISLVESVHRHREELLQHIDDQTADYQRLQTKKSELQSKRNLQLSSSVIEIDRTKKYDKSPGSVSSIQPGQSKEQEHVREESTLSPSASVDEKLEHLKKSLKKRN